MYLTNKSCYEPLMHLQKELNQLEAYITSLEKIDPSISSKNIGWHVDHSLKVINSVVSVLKESDPTAYKWKFNLLRTYIYTFNYFPRGKAKAPKRVLPPEQIRKTAIYDQIAKAKSNLEIIAALPATSNFQHPYFGTLNLRQTLKFLSLHTNHHLKICRDILI